VGGRVWLSALCVGIFLSTGCGSSGSSTTAQLRFFQASPDAPHVNVLVDGASVATNLGYGNDTGYISVKSGSRHIQIVPLIGSSPILDESLSISSGANQTLLLTGPAASIKPVVLTDGGTKVTTGDGYVRVVNASSTMRPAAVYIVVAGTSIGGAQPVTGSMPLAFDEYTKYELTAAGNYQVFMTAPGTTNAFLSTGPIDLSASANQTIVALDSISGGFTYLRLTDQ
jgi:hypothetical protein